MTLRVTRVRVAETPIVSLEEIRSFCSVDYESTEQDALLTSLVEASLLDCEAYTHQYWGKSVMTCFLSFVVNGTVELPSSNLTEESIEVEIKVSNGTWFGLEKDTDYRIVFDCGRYFIKLLTDHVVGDFSETLKVSFETGYTNVDVPKNISLGIKMQVLSVYDSRADQESKGNSTTVAERLWNAHRIYSA